MIVAQIRHVIGARYSCLFTNFSPMSVLSLLFAHSGVDVSLQYSMPNLWSNNKMYIFLVKPQFVICMFNFTLKVEFYIVQFCHVKGVQ